MNPEYFRHILFDRSATADTLLREEPQGEEDEEDDDKDTNDDDGDDGRSE